jgi:diadenosine tetraphosphate (Ap4A) HIT family hydrolase
MNPALHCPFCCLPDDRVLAQDAHGKVIRDAYPVSPGHMLVIPHRHVGSFFDLSTEERSCLLALLDEARRSIEVEHRPDGYNIGINDGPTAGQTVPHLHIHLIPRYAGDRTDPRGGVRWIFPDKADYWTARAQAAPGT